VGRPAKNVQPRPLEPNDGAEPEVELGRLMVGYQQGQLDAFDAVYAALAGRIRGYLYTMCRDASLADDLLQDTFMQLHRSRRTYEPGRPVTPWVFAIARHVFLMHRRRTGRRLRFEDALLAETLRGDRPHDDVSALIDEDEVRRALRHVPADQREAVLMHHVEGHSFAEIAARLGIRVNAAKTRAFRGMKKMRETLTRSGE
jgi:RNA polymerase sigma-70 factor (ECF subfamily)